MSAGGFGSTVAGCWVWMSLCWGSGSCFGLGCMVCRGCLWEVGIAVSASVFPRALRIGRLVGGDGGWDCISFPLAAQGWIVSFGLVTSVKFPRVVCLWCGNCVGGWPGCLWGRRRRAVKGCLIMAKTLLSLLTMLT